MSDCGSIKYLADRVYPSLLKAKTIHLKNEVVMRTFFGSLPFSVLFLSKKPVIGEL
jgi:hypothetical protein